MVQSEISIPHGIRGVYDLLGESTRGFLVERIAGHWIAFQARG